MTKKCCWWPVLPVLKTACVKPVIRPTLPATSKFPDYRMEVDTFLYMLLQDCLLCPTGFSANMAFMTVVGYVGSLQAVNEKGCQDGVAIFSDALNHASIIDGIRLAERQGCVKVFIYRHCDMAHLNGLL